MFRTRLVAAASVALLTGAFVLAQQQPNPGPSQPQGQSLPGQQPNTTAPATPEAPVAPAAQPGAVPSQPQNPTQVQPNQVPPGQAQPNRNPQPRTQENSQRTKDNSQRSSDSSNQASAEDAKFVTKAGEINLAEINIGRLAAQRASRQDVRQFANQLVQDHSMNLQQLNQLANRNHWKGAERMDQEHQQLFQKLATMEGQQFDREFVQKMVEGHKKAAEAFKHASENCKNAELKQYATQTLAAIQQHEKEAQRLNGQNQNQGQTTQPTSSEQNSTNRTDGKRVEEFRNDQNRNIQNPTDGNRNNTTPNADPNRNSTTPNADPNRNNQNQQEKTSPDRRDGR